jgi:hypothetical protein
MQNNISLANSETGTHGRKQLRQNLRQKYSGSLSEKLWEVLSAESVCKVKVHPRISHDVPKGE